MNIWKRGVCLAADDGDGGGAGGPRHLAGAADAGRDACRSCRGRWTRLWSPRTLSASW